MSTLHRGSTHDVRADSHRERRFSTGQLLMIPALAVVGVFTIYPLVRMFINSAQAFSRKNLFTDEAPEWVGLQNFTTVLTDSYFWQVFLRTLLLTAVEVTLTMTLAMFIALTMRRLSKGMRTLLSVGLVLAWAMPPLTATIIFRWMVDSRYGVLNYLLKAVNLQGPGDFSWIDSTLPFFVVVTAIIVWGAIPFCVFTIYAGLTQVSEEMMEAAELDGANAWQRFWRITLPSIRNVVAIVLVLQLIWDLPVFTQINALQGANVPDTDTIGTYIYRLGIGKGQYGTASAISIILAVVMFIIALPYIRNLLKQEKKS